MDFSMKSSLKYYLVLVVASFIVGVLVQGLISLLSWTAYPVQAYLFSGAFWALVWPFVQLSLDKVYKSRS